MDKNHGRSDRPFAPDSRTDCILVCGQEIDGLSRPVQVDAEGTVSILPNAATYAQAGRFFAVNSSLVLPTEGAFIAFTFENPVDNDQAMFLEQVAAGIFVNEVVGTRVGNEETLELLVAQIPQVRDVDTTLTPVNNLVGSPKSSTLLVRTVNDFDLGPVHFSAIYPSGELTSDFRGRLILPPGHILLIMVIDRAQNISNALLIATVTWWERPLPKKERRRRRAHGKETKTVKNGKEERE